MNKTNCACKCEHCGSTLEVKKEKVNPEGLVFEKTEFGRVELMDDGKLIYGYYQRQHIIDRGLEFITRQDAELADKKRLALQRIRKYIYDNDMGFEPDWDNINQKKHSICWNIVDRKLSYVICTWSKSLEPFWLRTVDEVDQVIRDCEADLNTLLGVEE